MEKGWSSVNADFSGQSPEEYSAEEIDRGEELLVVGFGVRSEKWRLGEDGVEGGEAIKGGGGDGGGREGGGGRGGR